MNTTDYSNDAYTIKFVDINDKAIADKKIKFVLNGITYTRTTDSNGTASVPLNLGIGTYNIVISFAADNDYYQTSKNCVITIVESAQAEVTISKTKESITASIVLSKAINGNVNVNIDGENYKVNLVDGKGSLNIANLKITQKLLLVQIKLK